MVRELLEKDICGTDYLTPEIINKIPQGYCDTDEICQEERKKSLNIIDLAMNKTINFFANEGKNIQKVSNKARKVFHEITDLVNKLNTTQNKNLLEKLKAKLNFAQKNTTNILPNENIQAIIINHDGTANTTLWTAIKKKAQTKLITWRNTQQRNIKLLAKKAKTKYIQIKKGLSIMTDKENLRKGGEGLSKITKAIGR